MDLITSFISSDIRTATPLLIAGLGVVFSARAGIVNIGIEGFMLLGALMGVIGSYLCGSAFVGALFAMAFVMILSSVFAFFTINIKADQTVVGTAINIISMGLTITVNRVMFGTNTVIPQIKVFTPVPIPILSKIPVIGQALFNHPIITYMAFLTVPIAWYIMNKTHYGLKIRAVGENPRACDTVGINVSKLRWSSILISGLMSGLAGAFVSMGQLSFFVENMIAGRGFMVLAVIVFGNYSPLGVMIAALVFGAGDAVMYRLQAANTGIPYQISMLLPYLITIFAVCGFIKKSKPPASSGIAYIRE